MSKYSDLCGWVHRPQAIEKALKSLPFPTFGAIKLIKGSGRGKEVLLHRIVTDVIGYYPIFSQQIGDCVSMSAAGSATALQAIEVRVDGNEEFGGIIATEPIYADSRVAIGQGQLGYEDGSVSAWACQAMQKYGTVVRQNYPDVGVDLTNYNPNYSKTWGSPNKGTPKGLWDISRKHTIVTFSQIG